MTALSDLTRHTQAARALIAVYRDVLAEDEDLKRDTIEGETNLMEALNACIERLAELKTLQVGIKAVVEQITARKQRLEAQEARIRDAMLTAMDLAGVDKIEAPLGTASRKRVPPSAVIVDETQVPTDYFIPQAPKLDKRAVLAALKAGTGVPGAELSNGGASVQVRFN